MIKIVIQPKMTRAELAALVCEALVDALDDSPILVGGAAASIYSEGRYLSHDLDIITYRTRKELAPVMERLGFEERGSYWRHSRTELVVQFVAPPPMIGSFYVRKPTTMATSAGTLRVISALQSACDRLAWYLQGDMQALEQCASVVIAQRVRLTKIRSWLAGEEWSKKEKERALTDLQREVRRQRR